MSDLIKDSIEQAQNIALAGLKGGYEIGKRESAAKLAEKDAAIAELREALDHHGRLLSETEINYWKEWLQDIGKMEVTPPGCNVLCLMALQFLRAQEILAKHAPILPNLHSHHDHAELLRDEYPDKYAGLKADAIRENGDTK